MQCEMADEVGPNKEQVTTEQYYIVQYAIKKDV